MRYIALAFIWLALIGISVVVNVVERPSSPIPVVAVRDLPANHLIQPGDLRADVRYSGYTAAPLHHDQIVTHADLSPLPSPLPQGLFLAFPVAASLVRQGTVDVGTKLRLCKGTDEIAKDLPVSAVTCGADDSCSVLVEAPVDKVKTPTDWLAPDVQVVSAVSCG